jgi:hypothetical protein
MYSMQLYRGLDRELANADSFKLVHRCALTIYKIVNASMVAVPRQLTSVICLAPFSRSPRFVKHLYGFASAALIATNGKMEGM